MYSITSTNVAHRGSARASLSNTGSRGEPAMDRNARPAARRSMLGMSAMFWKFMIRDSRFMIGTTNQIKNQESRIRNRDAIQDERVGAHAVGGVVSCGPSGTSGEELTQRPGLAALWISVVQKPIIEQEHRAVLQHVRHSREGVARRLVEVAIE